MDEKQFKALSNKLDILSKKVETITRMQDLLEDIKSILLLSNNDKIQQAKQQLLKENSEEKKIYDLCDGKTSQEIATAISKSAEYVGANLSRLRRKGLIKTIEKNGNKIHKQRF